MSADIERQRVLRAEENRNLLIHDCRAAIDFSFLSGHIALPAAFARASAAQATDASGKLMNFGVDIPRFDYSPLSHTANGLLIEPQKQNAFIYSGDLTNAAWSKRSTTVGLSSVLAPDGVSYMDEVVSTGMYAATYQTPINVSPGDVLTVSAYARYRDLQYLTIVQEAWTGGAKATFDLLNGTLFTTANASGGIIPIGGGLYRVRMTCTVPSSYTTFQPEFWLGIHTAVNYAGLGVYVWGAQIEWGSLPTSYIPTTSAIATRAADQLTFAVPSNVAKLRYTFDDNSAQDVTVSSGVYTVPTSLNRSAIKRIQSL